LHKTPTTKTAKLRNFDKVNEVCKMILVQIVIFSCFLSISYGVQHFQSLVQSCFPNVHPHNETLREKWSSTTNTEHSNSTSFEDNPINLHFQYLEELKRMGWSHADSVRALNVSNDNLIAAAMLLDEEQEESVLLNKMASDLETQGWNFEAAITALKESEGNSTKAGELLVLEEKNIQEHFENAVNEMVL
jgi:hypothetical protein